MTSQQTKKIYVYDVIKYEQCDPYTDIEKLSYNMGKYLLIIYNIVQFNKKKR